MGEFEKRGQIPFPERNDTLWRSETHLRDYLYRISVLREQGVIPIREFPAFIDLNSDWHGVIDRMREESRDGFERIEVFGFRSGVSPVYFPMEFNKGTAWEAPSLNLEVIKKSHGLVSLGGELHSHGQGKLERMITRAYLLTGLAKSIEGFSPNDLYWFVEGTGFQMEGVVELFHTYFAFRTAETNAILAEKPLLELELFVNYWHRQIGVFSIIDNKLAIALSFPFDLEKMNRSIAEAYSLALYRGNPGEHLVRIHP